MSTLNRSLRSSGTHRLEVLRGRPIRRLLFLFPSLLAGVIACTDNPVGPTTTTFGPSEPEEVLESISGIVVSERLLQSGDRMIALAGGQTDLLVGLIGAEIFVQGVYDDSDGALVIRSFTVLAVDGIPALDGVLYQFDEGFYIGTTDLGGFSNLPEELGDYVGRRVWLSVMNDECMGFGVLEF